jgi:hypothetical protein
MGGGGISGGFIPPAGTNGDTEKCDDILINTTLDSPDQDVLKKLNRGDVLKLIKSNEGQLIAVTGDNSVAGSITHYLYKKIIDCIEDGVDFNATINKLNGGDCRVRIEPDL